jgi:hypothetical protein
MQTHKIISQSSATLNVGNLVESQIGSQTQANASLHSSKQIVVQGNG